MPLRPFMAQRTDVAKRAGLPLPTAKSGVSATASASMATNVLLKCPSEESVPLMFPMSRRLTREKVKSPDNGVALRFFGFSGPKLPVDRICPVGLAFCMSTA